MEYAIGFLKPDCLKRNIEGQIYRIIEKSGLEIVFRKRTFLNLAQSVAIYHMCVYKDYFDELIEYLLSDQVEIYVVKGGNAIYRLNQIVGEQGSANPSAHTIRGIFATSAQENVIHSTSNRRTHNREVVVLLNSEGDQFKNVDLNERG